jgi:hypothetical protein
LPKSIRDQLGRRIEDGEEGQELVNWLNGLPEVREILEKQFGGRPVTEQNLSEWKQGGYEQWLRQEDLLSLVGQVAEESEDLEGAADGQEISDRFAGLMAVELARLATALLEKETDPEKRWKRLCEVHRELSQLRRDDHRAVRRSSNGRIGFDKASGRTERRTIAAKRSIARAAAPRIGRTWNLVRWRKRLAAANWGGTLRPTFSRRRRVCRRERLAEGRW